MQNEEHSLSSLDIQGSEAQGLGALLCGADEGGACFLQNVCGFLTTQFSLSINTSHFKVWHNRYQLSIICLIFLALVPEVLNLTYPSYEHRSGKKE